MTFKAQLVRLDQIAQINPKRRVSKGASVAFVEMAALPQNFRDINPSEVEIRTAKGAGAHFQNGDTLLARITPCLENGKTAQVNCLKENSVGEGSTEFIVLCGIDREDDDYVYYLCRDATFREYAIGRMEGTSGRQRVSWQSIAAYEFVFPPPSQRRAAAQTLSLLDDRITMLRETNKTLEAIAQALFKSWFVDFDPVRAKADGKLPEGIDAATAALFPDAFEKTELGLVPKGWAFKAIGDLLVPKRGKSITKTKCVEGDIPVVAGGLEPAYFHNQSNVSSPVVTISASGANAGFVRLYQQDIWASDCSFVSAEQTEEIYFWYVFLKFNQEKIYFMQQGAAQPHIYPSDLIRLHICSPQVDKLRGVFNSLVSPLFDRIGLNDTKIQTLSNIRESLLPRLISGRLRIADAEAELERAIA